MPVPKVVRAALERHGMLLVTDKALPSVAALLAGGPVTGSWWSHPEAAAIYHCCNDLNDDPDVLAVKLVLNKVTFVHRRHWAALLGVARARSAWQTDGLDREAEALEQRVTHEGRVTLEGKSAAATELEARLLALSAEEHTASGAHAKVLESWATWQERAAPRVVPLAPDAATAVLEAAVAALGTSARLPWQRGRRARSS